MSTNFKIIFAGKKNKRMKNYRMFILILLWAACRHCGHRQRDVQLDYYIGKTTESSPLAQDRGNQGIDFGKRKAVYEKCVHPCTKRCSLAITCLSPSFPKDNGTTSFKWNAQQANDYYGYDLGVNNGNVQGGIAGTNRYWVRACTKLAETQLGVQHDILQNNIRLNRHDIERNVTDQYILCMLDRNMMGFADSVSHVLSGTNRPYHPSGACRSGETVGCATHHDRAARQ